MKFPTLDLIVSKMSRKGEIMLKIAMFLMIIIYLNQFSYANSNELSQSPTLIEIDTMITSSSWSERFRAAKTVLEAPDFDTLRAVNMLIDGIRMEIRSPAIPNLAEIRGGATTVKWDQILRAYIQNLASMGTSILPQLSTFADTNDTKTLSWIIIARGLIGDTLVHHRIRTLALDNSDPNLRAMAIEALAVYSSKDDFEIFQQALSDSSKLISSTDVSMDGGKSLKRNELFPVRIEAINALRKIGYSVIPDSRGGYIINEIK